MKFKKISAALTAIAMAATMVAGMAMTASASPVVENDKVIGDGGFYYLNSADVWTQAPHGMYDGVIYGDVELEEDEATLILQPISIYGTVGYITSLVETGDNVNIVELYTKDGEPVYSDFTTPNGDPIQLRTATLSVNTTYTMTVEMVIGTSETHSSTMEVQFQYVAD